jgi:sugar-specific transcriptional regulator TrmB
MSSSNNIEEALKQYGLDTEQIAIYLYLIQHGDDTPFNISKGTTIPRTTVYRILEELRNIGIVSLFKKNNVAYYSPESARRLVQRLKEKEAAVTNVLPAIESLFQTSGNVPHVKMYVGQNGARAGLDVLYETIEKRGFRDMYTYAHPDLSKHLPKYLSTLIERRKKLKIKVKLIAPSSARGPELEHYQPDEWREMRYMPENFPFHGTMIMSGTIAVCFSLKDNQLHTIVLESESIVTMFKQFFLYTWETLKE